MTEKFINFETTGDASENGNSSRDRMADLRRTAEKVDQLPSFMRTQSSAARTERDMRRAGIDPVTRQRIIGSPAVREGLDVDEQAEPVEVFDPDPLTVERVELWRKPIEGQLSGDRHHGQPGDPLYSGE